ncbi:type II toxin-antitoxin system RelE/ParE family toxin [Streptomyces tuirus]|uniref:Toxin RelE n=1 Tax=Streptomyces tuirus TaxID=68278 RepID=A0A7G1NHH5_9ACTN|nr:hypothetical protein GCM10017668_23680 [Streptomyces tuirus]
MTALGVNAKAAVTDAMKRLTKQEHMPYEQEHIEGRLQAVRVFYDGCTYRALYASVGNHDEVLLALHVVNKKSRKLPLAAKRKALKRLKDWESRD